MVPFKTYRYQYVNILFLNNINEEYTIFTGKCWENENKIPIYNLKLSFGGGGDDIAST